MIPEEWECSRLGCHLREPIKNGYSPICPSHPTGVWILSLSAVSSDGFNITGVKPAPANDPKIISNLLSAGDLVISRSNTPDRVGLAGIYPGYPKPCSYPDLLMRVRLRESLNQEFLLLWLLSTFGRRFFSDNARGSSGSMVKVDRKIVESFPVPVPRPSEQRAIAAVLSDVDALIASLDRLIAKKRDMKQAAMQELLTGKRRLPGFSGEWEVKRLGDLCEKITTGKLDANAMVPDGEYPFFTCARERYAIDTFAFDAEALLVSGNGANVGYIHYYKGKFNAYQRTYVLTGFNATIQYIKRYMERNLQDRLRSEVNAGNTPYIVMSTLTDMLISLPRNFSEQTAIATILSDMDTEIAALEQKRHKTQLLKQGMMQELLTGRTRLA
ncbi:restriction endonuclease subunit S [Geobacter grbiciae]|nr:restriction endonuclease subunit S [Geobacter grbiciae]